MSSRDRLALQKMLASPGLWGLANNTDASGGLNVYPWLAAFDTPEKSSDGWTIGNGHLQMKPN